MLRHAAATSLRYYYADMPRHVSGGTRVRRSTTAKMQREREVAMAFVLLMFVDACEIDTTRSSAFCDDQDIAAVTWCRDYATPRDGNARYSRGVAGQQCVRYTVKRL